MSAKRCELKANGIVTEEKIRPYNKPTWPEDIDPSVYGDWRDAKAYQQLSDLSLEAFAWEYMRRRPIYIRGYREYLDERARTSKEGQKKLLIERGNDHYLRAMYPPEKSAIDLIQAQAYHSDEEPPQIFIHFPGAWVLEDIKAFEFTQRTFPQKQWQYEKDEWREARPFMAICVDSRFDTKRVLREVAALIEQKKNELAKDHLLLKSPQNERKRFLAQGLQLIDGLIAKAQPSEIKRAVYGIPHGEPISHEHHKQYNVRLEKALTDLDWPENLARF